MSKAKRLIEMLLQEQSIKAYQDQDDENIWALLIDGKKYMLDSDRDRLERVEAETWAECRQNAELVTDIPAEVMAIIDKRLSNA